MEKAGLPLYFCFVVQDFGALRSGMPQQVAAYAVSNA